MIKQLLEKQKEEFDEKFPLFGCEDEYYCPVIETEGWKGDIACGDKSIRVKLKDFLTQSQISLIKTVVEMIKDISFEDDNGGYGKILKTERILSLLKEI